MEMLRGALDWVEQLGALGPILFILLYIVVCVLAIPASVLTLGAGAMFGVLKGTILASVASTLGATAAFVVGRYFARGRVARFIDKDERFKAVDEAVAREGWKIVVLTRLSPVFPFNLQNYAYGLTRVSLHNYVAASWIGMLPGTVLFVYLGSLARLGVETEQAGPAWTAIKLVGLLATIAVTILVTRIARRALEKKVL